MGVLVGAGSIVSQTKQGHSCVVSGPDGVRQGESVVDRKRREREVQGTMADGAQTRTRLT